MNSKDELTQQGYYLVECAFGREVMKISKTTKHSVKHNYGWERKTSWLNGKPEPVSPSMLNRFACTLSSLFS